MRVQKRFLAVVMSVAMMLPGMIIPQTVKAASDIYKEDTMLDFSKNGSHTVKFAADAEDPDIDRYWIW